MVLVSLKYKVHQTVIQTHGIHVPQMVDDPAFRILSRLCSCIVTVLAVISQADKIMCCPIGRRKGKDSGDPRLAGRNVDNQVYGRFPRALLGVYLDW